MKNTLTDAELMVILISHFQSTSKPGEVVSVENVQFISDGEVCSIDEVSVDVNISRPRKGRPVGRPVFETSVSREELLFRVISSFDLPASIRNSLDKGKILYIWQLVVLSDRALLQVRGIGKVNLRIIRTCLRYIPEYNSTLEKSAHNVFFRKIFGLRSADLRPKQELSSVTDVGRFDEMVNFIRSFFL